MTQCMSGDIIMFAWLTVILPTAVSYMPYLVRGISVSLSIFSYKISCNVDVRAVLLNIKHCSGSHKEKYSIQKLCQMVEE